jgi:hypothetical protein
MFRNLILTIKFRNMKKTGRAGLISIKDIRKRESDVDLTFAYDNGCHLNKYPYMARGACI